MAARRVRAAPRPAAVAAAGVLVAACGPEPVREVPLDAETRLAASCVLPMDDSTGNPLVRALLDGREARLLVDTGSELTILDPRFARAAGLELLPYTGAVTTRHAGRSARVEQVARVRRLALGTAEALDLHVPLLDLAHLERPIDGILGQDVLGDFPVVLDSERGALHLVAGELERHLATLVAPGTAMVQVELTGAGRTPAFELEVEGVGVVPALLDTGATLSGVPRRVADALHLEPDGSGTSRSASGVEERERRRLTGVRIGPWELSTTATVHEGDAVLLGYDTLKPFLLAIDTPGRRVVLAHRPERAGGIPRGR